MSEFAPLPGAAAAVGGFAWPGNVDEAVAAGQPPPPTAPTSAAAPSPAPNPASAPAAASPAAATPAVPFPTTLVISVIAAEEKEVFFKVKRTTKFSRVFKAYFQHISLHPEDYCFLTTGPAGRRVVEDKCTCNSLHLFDGSKILCAKDRRALP